MHEDVTARVVHHVRAMLAGLYARLGQWFDGEGRHSHEVEWYAEMEAEDAARQRDASGPGAE